MRISKKGQVMSQLQGFILGLAGVTVILAVVLLTLSELQVAADKPAEYCSALYTYNASANNCYLTANSSQPTVDIVRTDAYDATGTVISKLATVPTWIGIVIVVALAFIVMGFFYVRSQSNM